MRVPLRHARAKASVRLLHVGAKGAVKKQGRVAAGTGRTGGSRKTRAVVHASARLELQLFLMDLLAKPDKNENTSGHRQRTDIKEVIPRSRECHATIDLD